MGKERTGSSDSVKENMQGMRIGRHGCRRVSQKRAKKKGQPLQWLSQKTRMELLNNGN